MRSWSWKKSKSRSLTRELSKQAILLFMPATRVSFLVSFVRWRQGIIMAVMRAWVMHWRNAFKYFQLWRAIMVESHFVSATAWHEKG